jgi:hypothetical protein
MIDLVDLQGELGKKGGAAAVPSGAMSITSACASSRSMKRR